MSNLREPENEILQNSLNTFVLNVSTPAMKLTRPVAVVDLDLFLRLCLKRAPGDVLLESLRKCFCVHAAW